MSCISIMCMNQRVVSLSTRTLYRTPPLPALNGPKFSHSEKCEGYKNQIPSKFFWDIEGHRSTIL